MESPNHAQTPLFERLTPLPSSPLSSLPPTSPLRDNVEETPEDAEMIYTGDSCTEMEEDTLEGGPSSNPRRHQRYNFAAKQKVLQKVVDVLKEHGWSFTQLLEIWTEEYIAAVATFKRPSIKTIVFGI